MTSAKDRLRLDRVLRRLQRDQTYVRVRRRQRGADRLDGYVVAIGRTWVLLAVSAEAHPGGWEAVRLRDIRRIHDAPGRRLVRKAFQLEGSWPPPVPTFPVDLDSTRALITSLGAGVDMVVVHVEGRDPDVAFFGRVRLQDSRSLWLSEVDPSGRWSGLFPHRRKTISRLGFGDRYGAMLLRVAGPRPSGE